MRKLIQTTSPSRATESPAARSSAAARRVGVTTGATSHHSKDKGDLGAAQAGFEALPKYLVHGPHQTLGLPWNGFKATMSKLEPRDSIPDREGDNALVSYQCNVVTDPDGVRVAASNCLSCHASRLFGKVVIGLGHPTMAMLQGQSTGASFDIPGILLRSSPDEAAVQFGAMDVFPVLASHHDPTMLVWQETPVCDGDTAIDDNFVDVEAYIHSLIPPRYPGKTEQARATAGKAIYGASLSEPDQKALPEHIKTL